MVEKRLQAGNTFSVSHVREIKPYYWLYLQSILLESMEAQPFDEKQTAVQHSVG